MNKIAIFASGSGTNAENIIKYFEKSSTIQIALIISNKVDAFVHQRAKNSGIESITFTGNDFATGLKIADCLKERNINFVVLSGFLLKIPSIIIKNYPHQIINIHPALLPKYGGKGMYGNHVHKAVLAAQEKETGITIHYVDENYDEGNIIFQAKCTIEPADSCEDIAQKVHVLEYAHFPAVIERLLA